MATIQYWFDFDFWDACYGTTVKFLSKTNTNNIKCNYPTSCLPFLSLSIAPLNNTMSLRLDFRVGWWRSLSILRQIRARVRGAGLCHLHLVLPLSRLFSGGGSDILAVSRFAVLIDHKPGVYNTGDVAWWIERIELFLRSIWSKCRRLDAYNSPSLLTQECQYNWYPAKQSGPSVFIAKF